MHFVSELGEQASRDLTHGLLILDHQNGYRCAYVRSPRLNMLSPAPNELGVGIGFVEVLCQRLVAVLF